MQTKNIFIIGGNSGIGQKLVKELESQNHNVYCALRRPEEINSQTVISQIYDAENPSQLEVPEILDGVVYCPGSINLKPFHRMSKQEFQKDLEINFLGAVDVLQQCYKPLKKAKQASVVLFSTVAVQTGMSFHASIASAKAAIEGLTRSLAAEWAPNIRVNAIAPSLTNTPLANQFLSNEQKKAAAEQRHPLKSIGDPESVSSLVSFLLNDQGSFMTGQVLQMDGGMSRVRTFN